MSSSLFPGYWNWIFLQISPVVKNQFRIIAEGNGDGKLYDNGIVELRVGLFYSFNILLRVDGNFFIFYLKQMNLLSNMRYSRSWTEKYSTELSGFGSYYYLDGSNVSNSDPLFHLQENEVLDWGLKLESRSNINRNVELLGGYQFREVGIRNQDNIRNPGYIRDVKDVLRIHSLYADAELNELIRNVYLRAGMRSNYYSQLNSFSFEPRVAFSYKLSDHFSLELLAEKKSQYTTQLIDFQADFFKCWKAEMDSGKQWKRSPVEEYAILCRTAI